MMKWISVLFCVFSVTSGRWVKEMKNGGLYQGDMMLTPGQLADVTRGQHTFGVSKKIVRWPRTIYYDWDYDLENEPSILAAIADLEKYTCLRFKKRTNQATHMYFVKAGGCFSPIGYSGGRHYISLGDGCRYKDIVIHEIGHALGLFHEQARPDRDNYVKILFENIEYGQKHNFKKQKVSALDPVDTPYDYLSLMHYESNAFSKNGKPTILAKDKSMQDKMGRVLELSKYDKIHLNKMYCGKRPTGIPPKPTGPTTEPPSNTFALKNTNGRCLAVDSNNILVLSLSLSCATKFRYENGNLYLADTNSCAQPVGNKKYAKVKMVSNCPRSPTFTVANTGSADIAIQHVKTRKCLTPYGSASRPGGTISIVMSYACYKKSSNFILA